MILYYFSLYLGFILLGFTVNVFNDTILTIIKVMVIHREVL